MSNQLTRLFLIDQSLETTGTHHADLLETLALQAMRHRIDVRAGVNLEFPESSSLSVPVKRCYANSTYQSVSRLAGLRRVKRNAMVKAQRRDTRFSWFKNWLTSRINAAESSRRDRLIVRFAQNTSSFFNEIEFEDSDHVLFLCVSELELLGAFRYLAQTPRTIQANWSFLFHFNVFTGNPATFPAQARQLKDLCDDIHGSIRALPYHRLRFFATTDALVEQYQRLGISTVRAFSYPVPDSFDYTADFSKTNEMAGDRPFRFVVAGGVRREKGQQANLREILEGLCEIQRSGVEAELQIQRPKRPRWCPPKLDMPKECAEISGVNMVDHPLPAAEYNRLIRESDCGILLYDRENYAARRAGIFGEFASCAKPMIVSAGCWLSDQLETFQSAHVHNLICRHEGTLCEISNGSFEFCKSNVPLPGSVWSFDSSMHPFVARFDLDCTATSLLIEFEWHFRRAMGTYCQWELFHDDRLAGMPRIVGQGRKSPISRCIIPLNRKLRLKNCSLKLSNPYSDANLSIKGVRVFACPESLGELPISSAGLAIGHASEVPWAMREIVKHKGHYQKTAVAFAGDWLKRHASSNALSEIIPPFQLKSKAA
ncbi:MAG: hypothetical protein R3C03_02790 [Pirellulaceae bacterium]